MKNLRIDSSTDGEFEQRAAEAQPYNLVEVIVTTGQRSLRTEDGGTEHVEPVTENLSALMPGRELRENMLSYAKKVGTSKKKLPISTKLWANQFRFRLPSVTRS